MQMKMPRLAKLRLSAEEVAENGLLYLRNVEQRLSDCENCSGEKCSATSPRPGETPIVLKGKILYEQCQKYINLRILKKLMSAGVGQRFLNCTIDNYQPNTKDQKIALARTKKYLSTLPSERGLLISGPVGTGKTHLAIAVLRTVFSSAAFSQIMFYPLPKLLSGIREQMGKSRKQNLLEESMKVDFLVLDDLGAERVTDWVAEQLYILVNERYENMRPTIFTTNCDLETLEKNIGQRTMSRIMEMCDGILLTGEDYRKRKLRSA